ncbi:MAG: hypothetical protein H7839_05160 [Magnetococcus sp. YQC-5]
MLLSGAMPYTVQGPVVKTNCSNCHAWRTPVLKQRPLGPPHAGLLLRHGKATLWCLECHNPQHPSLLRTLSGADVPMTEAQDSCAICHGRTFFSWQEGVHGKRLTHWSGERVIQSCASCHAAHAPAVTPLVPQPPPRRGRARTTP